VFLRYGKVGNKKRATCFASSLQNELNTFYHPKNPWNLICYKPGSNFGGKTHTIAIQFVFSNVAKLIARFFCCPFYYSFNHRKLAAECRVVVYRLQSTVGSRCKKLFVSFPATFQTRESYQYLFYYRVYSSFYSTALEMKKWVSKAAGSFNTNTRIHPMP